MCYPKTISLRQVSFEYETDKRKLIETFRRKNEGWTTYQARKIAGISIRRVNLIPCISHTLA